MTTEDLKHQVSTTLGDHPEDFEIGAIVQEIVQEFGPIGSIDAVPSERYWAIVERHDVTRDA
jgi:hypothetical protein